MSEFVCSWCGVYGRVERADDAASYSTGDLPAACPLDSGLDPSR